MILELLKKAMKGLQILRKLLNRPIYVDMLYSGSSKEKSTISVSLAAYMVLYDLIVVTTEDTIYWLQSLFATLVTFLACVIEEVFDIYLDLKLRIIKCYIRSSELKYYRIPS